MLTVIMPVLSDVSLVLINPVSVVELTFLGTEKLPLRQTLTKAKRPCTLPFFSRPLALTVGVDLFFNNPYHHHITSIRLVSAPQA